MIAPGSASSSATRFPNARGGGELHNDLDRPLLARTLRGECGRALGAADGGKEVVVAVNRAAGKLPHAIADAHGFKHSSINGPVPCLNKVLSSCPDPH